MVTLTGLDIGTLLRLDLDIFNIIAYSLIVFAGCVSFGHALPPIFGLYGRYVQMENRCNINARLGWFILEFPAISIPIILLLCTDGPRIGKTPNMILLGCFLLHYVNRSLVYPLLIRGSNPVSLSMLLFGVAFCVFNGFLQSGYLLHHADFGENWSTKPFFYIGLCLFFLGMFLNIQSDHILRTLRKPGETGYKIPKGGLFEYVSGANFFSEIVEWFGFAVANGTLPTFAFFLSTIAAIAPRALKHHRWYKEKFEDYPKNRKAIIPYII